MVATGTCLKRITAISKPFRLSSIKGCEWTARQQAPRAVGYKCYHVAWPSHVRPLRLSVLLLCMMVTGQVIS